MGLDYIPKSQNKQPISVNIAGADILGCLHYVSGAFYQIGRYLN